VEYIVFWKRRKGEFQQLSCKGAGKTTKEFSATEKAMLTPAVPLWSILR
jgi:hypothetical protein